MGPKSKSSRKNISAATRLSDTAYERVLEGLFNGKIPVGGFVSQNEVSAIVDVPVGPLRDALRVLEAEGILTIHPRSGIQFVKPGMELTRAAYQFRLIIEQAAVRVFAEQSDEALTEDLEKRHLNLVHAVENDGLQLEDFIEIESLEQLLHGGVVSILQNPLIDTNYRRIHNYLKLLRIDHNYTAPVVMRTLREHLDIIKACRSRDADKAEEALKRHFQAATQRALGII